jgi:outer membrane protein assembly factor BamB
VKLGPAATVALDARTGTLVWRFRDGRYSPIVSDGKRVYMTTTGRIFGLEPCSQRPTAGRTKPYRGLLKTC